MKKLSNILSGIKPIKEIGSKTITLSGLAFDSRKVEKGHLYIATRGTIVDGHTFISKAIELGANSIVCEEIPEVINQNISYILVKDSHESLGIIASNWFDNPSKKLKLVGVTGTNGKTTTASL